MSASPQPGVGRTTIVVLAIVGALVLLAAAAVVIAFSQPVGRAHTEPSGPATSAPGQGGSANDGSAADLAVVLQDATDVTLDLDVTDKSDYCSIWLRMPEDVDVDDWAAIALAAHDFARNTKSECFLDIWESGDRGASLSLTMDDAPAYDARQLEEITRATVTGGFRTYFDVDYNDNAVPRVYRDLELADGANRQEILATVVKGAADARREFGREDVTFALRFDGEQRSAEISFEPGELNAALRTLQVGLRFADSLPDPAGTISADAVDGYAWGYVHVNEYSDDGDAREWETLSTAEKKTYTDLIDQWRGVLTEADISVIIYGNYDLL